jgi:hypothetical protein
VGDESAASRFVFLRHLREMLMFVGGPKTNYQPWGVASVYAARAKYRPWGVASAAQRLINYPSVERVLSRTMQIYVSSLVAKRLLLPLVVLVCCQFSFSFFLCLPGYFSRDTWFRCTVWSVGVYGAGSMCSHMRMDIRHRCYLPI